MLFPSLKSKNRATPLPPLPGLAAGAEDEGKRPSGPPGILSETTVQGWSILWLRNPVLLLLLPRAEWGFTVPGSGTDFRLVGQEENSAIVFHKISKEKYCTNKRLFSNITKWGILLNKFANLNSEKMKLLKYICACLEFLIHDYSLVSFPSVFRQSPFITLHHFEFFRKQTIITFNNLIDFLQKVQNRRCYWTYVIKITVLERVCLFKVLYRGHDSF